MVLPTAPIAPPMPTTVPTELAANISEGVDNKFDDHPWCAAVAMHNNPIACHSACANGTKITAVAAAAHTSMASLRPDPAAWPRRMNQPASHPPPTLPMVAPTYTTISGGPSPCISTSNRSWRNFGSQNR